MPDNQPVLSPMRAPSLWVQLSSLLYIELTNWRWSYRTLIITGTIAPILSILGLGIFARDAGPLALAYVLTGNLVVSIMFGNMNAIQGHIMFLRLQGGLDYFATLPIRRSGLIVAIMLAFLLLSLPSLVVTLIVGKWYLGVPLHLSPLLVVVVPLCALPLACIGALIGVSVRRPEEGGAITTLVTFLLAGLGPVLVPPDRLPPMLNLLGWFSPAAYAASALRAVVLGPVTLRLGLDIAVLAGLAGVIFWLIGKKMDWRQEA